VDTVQVEGKRERGVPITCREPCTRFFFLGFTFLLVVVDFVVVFCLGPNSDKSDKKNVSEEELARKSIIAE